MNNPYRKKYEYYREWARRQRAEKTEVDVAHQLNKIFSAPNAPSLTCRDVWTLINTYAAKRLLSNPQRIAIYKAICEEFGIVDSFGLSA